MNIQCLLEYGDALWYGTDQGLYGLSLDRGSSRREVNFPVDSIKCLLSSTSTKPWCGTVGGLIVWDQDWRELPLANLGSNIRCLLQDNPAIWCGTNNGLGKYTGEDWETFGIRTKAGLLNTKINCLLLDRDVNLWCGTERGLARFDGQTFQVTLVDANITCLLQDTATLWCGTTSGLYYCNSNNRWDAVPQLAEAEVYALLKERDGNLWCATEAGLYVSDDSGWRSVGQMQLKCLLQDRQGRIWCGGDGFVEPECIKLVAGVYKQVSSADMFAANSITEVSVPDTIESRPAPVPKEHKRENARPTPPVLEPKPPPPSKQTLPPSESGVADIMVPLRRWRRLPILLLLLAAALGWFLSQYSPPTPSPVAVVERFYQALSSEGRLDPTLTTSRLRSQVGSNTDLLMNRGNFQNLEVKVEKIDSDSGEVGLNLLLQDRLPLDTSITLQRGEPGWQVDRVRYYSQRRCRGGKNVTYLASDTNAFRAGRLIAGILRAPCY